MTQTARSLGLKENALGVNMDMISDRMANAQKARKMAIVKSLCMGFVKDAQKDTFSIRPGIVKECQCNANNTMKTMGDALPATQAMLFLTENVCTRIQNKFA